MGRLWDWIIPTHALHWTWLTNDQPVLIYMPAALSPQDVADLKSAWLRIYKRNPTVLP